MHRCSKSGDRRACACGPTHDLQRWMRLREHHYEGARHLRRLRVRRSSCCSACELPQESIREDPKHGPEALERSATAQGERSVLRSLRVVRLHGQSECCELLAVECMRSVRIAPVDASAPMGGVNVEACGVRGRGRRGRRGHVVAHRGIPRDGRGGGLGGISRERRTGEQDGCEREQMFHVQHPRRIHPSTRGRETETQKRRSLRGSAS